LELEGFHVSHAAATRVELRTDASRCPRVPDECTSRRWYVVKRLAPSTIATPKTGASHCVKSIAACNGRHLILRKFLGEKRPIGRRAGAAGARPAAAERRARAVRARAPWCSSSCTRP